MMEAKYDSITSPSKRRFIAFGLVIVVIVVVALGYQFVVNAGLNHRITEVETSLESMGISLNATLNTLSNTEIKGENTSRNIAVMAETLDRVEASLANLAEEISVLSDESPGNLVQRLQGLLNRTSVLESVLETIEDQMNHLDDTISDVGQIQALYESLNTTLTSMASEIGDLWIEVRSFTGNAPSIIYDQARKSVVVIRTNLGQGSGFFYAPGLILTNYHVIEGATRIEVEYFDRQRSTASLVGGDAYSDIAVIEVTPTRDLGILPLANSSKVLIGQQVIAIGNPLGLTGSLSLGYVAQVNKLTEIYPIIIPVLELDITIAPGSSGGPLIDLTGSVVGITNAGTGYGLNFAVPSNIASRAAQSIETTGSYEHPYVGVSLAELNPDYINSNNIKNIDPYQGGLMVISVEPGTPAANAGLQAASSVSGGIEAQDIILGIDGHPVLTFEDWAAYVEENISPGEPMMVELWRSGIVTTIPITPTSRAPYTE